jgi:hypothetical protein
MEPLSSPATRFSKHKHGLNGKFPAAFYSASYVIKLCVTVISTLVDFSTLVYNFRFILDCFLVGRLENDRVQELSMYTGCRNQLRKYLPRKCKLQNETNFQRIERSAAQNNYATNMRGLVTCHAKQWHLSPVLNYTCERD